MKKRDKTTWNLQSIKITSALLDPLKLETNVKDTFQYFNKNLNLIISFYIYKFQYKQQSYQICPISAIIPEIGHIFWTGTISIISQSANYYITCLTYLHIGRNMIQYIIQDFKLHESALQSTESTQSATQRATWKLVSLYQKIYRGSLHFCS